MLWALDASLSVFGTGNRPFLLAEEAEEGTRLLQIHLQLYHRMAQHSLRSRNLLYKFRPKHHYLSHLIGEVKLNKLNPFHLANFLDESFMGVMHGCVHACHPRSMLKVMGSPIHTEAFASLARYAKKEPACPGLKPNLEPADNETSAPTQNPPE